MQVVFAPGAIVWHPARAAGREFLGKVWEVHRRHGARESRARRRPITVSHEMVAREIEAAGGVAKDLMTVLETDSEHRVGQKLDDLPAHFEKFFLGQKRPLFSVLRKDAVP